MLEHCLVPVRFSVKIILSFVVTVPPVLHSGGGGHWMMLQSIRLSICLSVCPIPIARQWCILGCYGYCRTLIGNPKLPLVIMANTSMKLSPAPIHRQLLDGCTIDIPRQTAFGREYIIYPCATLLEFVTVGPCSSVWGNVVNSCPVQIWWQFGFIIMHWFLSTLFAFVILLFYTKINYKLSEYSIVTFCAAEIAWRK